MKKKTLLGVVGVDSGQLVVCDPCYIGSEWEETDDKYDLEHKRNRGKFSYGGCCVATGNKKGGGQLNYKLGHAGAGVAIHSGYGDGTYPVFAEYNSEGRVKRVTIEMIDDEVENIDDEFKSRAKKN